MRRDDISLAGAAMKPLCMLAGIILAVLMFFAGNMMHQTGRFVQLPGPVLSAFQGGGAGAPVQNGQNQEKVLNILLIGQDKREGEAGNRSDSIILCSFNREKKQVIMTSFLRDLYIPIPGHGSNRINAAYALGGAPLLIRTLEKNFDIPIDGSIEVDFTQFSQILDQLGGVTLELRQDEAREINRELGSSLCAGEQTLTGEQALAYARIRKLDPDGDFSRTARQRKVLGAVWDAYKNSSLPTLVKTMGKLVPMIETDLGSGELLRVVVSVFPYLSEARIVSCRVPEADCYTDQMVDGMAVLTIDPEAAKKLLHEHIYGSGVEAVS